MDELNTLLAEPLDTDDGHALTEQLAIRASWQARVSVMYREAEQELSKRRGQLFDPSLSSEDKRKISLEHAVRDFKLEADKLSDLADILKQHISLGQTLLRSMQAEMRSGL